MQITGKARSVYDRFQSLSVDCFSALSPLHIGQIPRGPTTPKYLPIIVDKVETTFDGALLFGADFTGSRIDRCRMVVSDGYDADPIAAQFSGKLEVIKAHA